MALNAVLPALLTALVFQFPVTLTSDARPVAAVEPEKVPDDVDQDEEKDYWKGVEFGPEDFAEVRRFVKLFYIDPSYDRRMAWVMAANFALHEMDPAREILPRDFLARKKKSRKERKRYGGKVTHLRKSDLFVIHEVGDRDDIKAPTGVLTAKEINRRKEEMRRKQEELEKAFARVPFTEDDFNRVMRFIEDHHAKKNKGEKGKNGDFKPYVAATRGYLASLDPHSTIISAKAWDESTKATTDSSFEGIGAVLTRKGKDTIIETPMEAQPAYKAGLRAGDVIVAVDKKPVSGMALHKVVKLIRGPKGTPVTLTIRRMGLPGDKDFVINRDHIEIKNVQQHMVAHHPDIGYVKITGFVPTTKEALDQAIKSLVEKAKGGRLRGLIVDLRYNSGGLLQESVDVADDFLNKGVIVSVKNPSDRDEVYKATPGSFDFPVVVVVNSSSASAAEILASAI
ncbi:MAG: PDZ domain-containing protein, partial [Deltaproteobacteria bacterium]|nr:PDZ domain-containing protein [Deltaproteobacteria bacterium]